MYVMESTPGPRTVINGKEVDYFSGCGYYDLQGHPEIIKAACEAVKKFGISSATSPLVYGNNPILQRIQTKACTFFGTESTLYFVSGFIGNSILLDGLRDQYDIIFVDEESHYSVLHAALIAQKPVVKFRYMDVEDFRKKVKENIRPSQRPLLICDGIFPISGDISPIPDYQQVLKEYDEAIICVDDAHATGVIGKKGRGTFEYLGIEGERLYSAGTLSKAIGGHGGIIAGSKELIETLNKNSNIHHACSQTPIPDAAAAAKALEMLYKNPGLRRQLWDNVSYAKKKLRSLGFNINDTPVPIICLRPDAGIDLEFIQSELFKRGLAVIYLPGGRYTSVPTGGALRISIFYSHTRKQIDRLVDTIKRFI
ncbi:MAG: pyridoxal phosphate-dependent aminotransferase family protein [Candidatus Aminicenantes bacterium]|nr:pyridoxal phosphate-dependent aminotransferase family protein [Candidatus Aminicenantes bacterium]